MSKDIRNEGTWDVIDGNRDYMKCPDFSLVRGKSDQEKALPQPSLSKEPEKEVIILSANIDDAVSCDSYSELLDIRRSERVYDRNAVMSKSQLAFLLWSTQGIQEIRG